MLHKQKFNTSLKGSVNLLDIMRVDYLSTVYYVNRLQDFIRESSYCFPTHLTLYTFGSSINSEHNVCCDAYLCVPDQGAPSFHIKRMSSDPLFRLQQLGGDIRHLLKDQRTHPLHFTSSTYYTKSIIH